MTLSFQTFPFTFSGGLNSKIDTFQLQSPQLLQADNVRFQLSGAVSKRPGFTKLSSNILGGGILASGVACQSFNGELLAFDGTYIYSYIESASAWANRGFAISVINDQKKIINTRIAQQNNPDGTNLNGFELYAWEDDRVSPITEGAGVRYSVVDSDTGAFVVADKFAAPLGSAPKTLAVPSLNQFNVYYCASYSTMQYNTILTDRPNLLQSQQTLFIDASGPTPTSYFAYDATLYQGLPLIAYGSIDGLKLNWNGTNYLVNNLTSISCISVTVDSNDVIWIVFTSNEEVSSGTYYTAVSNFNTTFLFGQVTPLIAVNIATIEDINLGALNGTYEIAASPYNYINNFTLSINNNLTTVTGQLGVGLASKPFKYNNQIYINTIWQSTAQSTYFTLSLTQNMKCVSKINPGVGGNYRNNNLLAQCDQFPGTGEFLFANQRKGAFTTNNNTSYSLLGVNASYIDFTNVNAFNSAVGANELHIVGGVEKIYDGVSVVEDNFHLYPEVADGYGCNVTLQAGGQLGTGQYQYVVVYTWSDNSALVERGQPSIPATVVATAGQAAYLQLPCLLITDKQDNRSPVSIEVYRTALTFGVPSSIFYKITDDANPIINNVNIPYLYFTDNLSDADILGNEPLYTSSQLFNSAPPACSLISPFLTRIFLSGMEDPNVIWTSQDRFELDNYNTIPIEFSPLLVEGVNPAGGPITAIAALDQAMIVFKSDLIYWFNGTGPNANGTAGNFSDAIPIPADSGCINPNSIISIPGNGTTTGGLLYQSNKGIFLVDRSYNNIYIGANVEQYNSYHITSAELLDDTYEVIFITLEGTVLVYNYYWNSWSTWSYLPAVDSCIWNNQLVLIQSNGNVLVQKDNYYYDYASDYQNTQKPVVRVVQIPWLAFGGIQGYHSVRWATLLGHYISPHILQMSVCYNYDPAAKEPIAINSNAVSNVFGGFPTFGAGATFGGGYFTPYQWQYNFGFQFGQSISIIISDTAINGGDQGAIFSALTFEVGVFQDTVRLPSRNKFGGVKGL